MLEVQELEQEQEQEEYLCLEQELESELEVHNDCVLPPFYSILFMTADIMFNVMLICPRDPRARALYLFLPCAIQELLCTDVALCLFTVYPGGVKPPKYGTFDAIHNIFTKPVIGSRIYWVKL